MTLEVITDQAPVQKHWGKLTRGVTRRKLMRELAIGEKTQRELAADYGCAQSAITQFAQRHADAIEAVRAHMDNEFAGLWIANKANRLAEYESDVEALSEVIDETCDDELLRIKHRALRNVAEEMGHLPPRVALTINDERRIGYNVGGVDMETLR